MWKYCTLRLQDIPSEGRRNLAHKLRLEERLFDDWAILDKVETYRDNYYFSVLVEKAWYKSSKEDWNWKMIAGFGQETAEYSCPGWKCSKEILHKLHTKHLSVSDIPFTGRDNLAHEVGLDKNEISAWISNFKVWTDEYGIHVSLHVPNTWITANILSFELNIFPAIGGIIGAGFTSAYICAISGKKEIQCNNFESLRSALNGYKGKIWGFTLFAHGHQNGVISNKTMGGKTNTQEELISLVQQNKYKLGRINLMQCYSGYCGKVLWDDKSEKNEKTLDDVKCRLEQEYHSTQYVTIEAIKVWYKKGNMIPEGKDDPIMATVTLSVNWAQAWSNCALKLYTYKGKNVCLLDTYIFSWIASYLSFH